MPGPLKLSNANGFKNNGSLLKNTKCLYKIVNIFKIENFRLKNNVKPGLEGYSKDTFLNSNLPWTWLGVISMIPFYG